MNPIPEAIEKHWQDKHWLFCGDHGLVAFMESCDLTGVFRAFEKAWTQHLEEKHNGRKP